MADANQGGGGFFDKDEARYHFYDEERDNNFAEQNI